MSPPLLPIGTLKARPPREAWANETTDFTPWLASNLHLLAVELGLSLQFETAERPVGDFAADIVALDTVNGRRVLIENQLERADHKHLGQLLTYLAGVESTIMIWIASSFRDEHLGALRWLNRNTSESHDFFAVQLQLFQIGDSPLVAPFFQVVEKPNTWERANKLSAQSAPSERSRLLQAFWKAYEQAYPGVDVSISGGGGTSRWEMVPHSDLVLSRYVATDGVGIFIRGGRGVPGEAILERLAPREADLTRRLGVGPGSKAFPYLKKRPADIKDHDAWPELGRWLYDETARYLQALEALPNEARQDQDSED